MNYELVLIQAVAIGNAKEIDERDVFIFFDVFVFFGGRRPPDQGRMFEKLHSERVRAM